MTRLHRAKGFTLIELVVVVVIIGVLATIASAAYNQFVGSSRTTAFSASAKQVEKYVTATSSEKDAAASALLDDDLNFSGKVQGAKVTRGTMEAGKFLVTAEGSARKACVVYAGSAGTPGTITLDVSAAAADDC